MSRNPLSPDAHELLARLSALSEDELAALKNAYYFRWIRQLLAVNGWLNLLLGGFTLWLGLTGIDESVLKVIQTLFGALIIGISLWSLIVPSRQTFFGYSILFVLAGAWNIFLAVRGGLDSWAVLILILGVLQLRWAYQFYQIYSARLPISVQKPSREIRLLYESIWRDFVMARYAHNDSLVEFLFRRVRWRGFTFGKYIALASPKNKLIIFADNSELAFETSIPDRGGKTLKGKFRFNALSNSATMQRDFFERYQQWKTEKDAFA